jgi:hypothetical protein
VSLRVTLCACACALLFAAPGRAYDCVDVRELSPAKVSHEFTVATGPVEGYQITQRSVCGGTAKIMVVYAFRIDGNGKKVYGPASLLSDTWKLPEPSRDAGLIAGACLLAALARRRGLWRSQQS